MREQKKKTYFLIFSFLIFFLCLLIFAIFPLLKSIEKQAKTIKEQKEKIHLYQKELEILSEFKKEFLEKNKKEKISSFFVKKEMPLRFVAFLENCAKENEVSLKISPSKTKEASFLVFILKAQSSSFQNLFNFLKKIEISPFLLEIDSLTFSQKEQKEGKRFVNLNLRVKVYAQKN